MSATDPCAQYEDSAGNVDILALIEGTLNLVECVIKEAKALGAGAPVQTAQAAQLAASQLRAAQASHTAYVNAQSPSKT